MCIRDRGGCLGIVLGYVVSAIINQILPYILTDGAALLDAEFRHGTRGSCHDKMCIRDRRIIAAPPFSAISLVFIVTRNRACGK